MISTSKGDRNGFVAIPNWQALTPIASATPSGGRHLYFASDGSVRCSSDAIASGVDVRGSGGYIIVPPTPGYAWLGLDILAPDATLPPLPAHLIPAQSKKERANGHDDDGAASSSLGAGSTGGERGAKAADADELAVAAACLRVISPNCSYKDWFEIACALHFEFGAGAFGMFDAFSARAPMKYDAEACRKKWAEAAKVHGFTMATLVFLANQYDPDWRELIPQQRARLEPNAGTKPDADAFELFDPWQPFVVPRFPLDVLPPAVRNFVMAQSAVIGTDVAGMAMSALEVMSAAIDARTRLKMMRHGDWEALARCGCCWSVRRRSRRRR